jgi:hypothetical protein
MELTFKDVRYLVPTPHKRKGTLRLVLKVSELFCSFPSTSAWWEVEGCPESQMHWVKVVGLKAFTVLMSPSLVHALSSLWVTFWVGLGDGGTFPWCSSLIISERVGGAPTSQAKSSEGNMQKSLKFISGYWCYCPVFIMHNVKHACKLRESSQGVSGPASRAAIHITSHDFGSHRFVWHGRLG